jgi:hypothetical protein
MLSMGKPQLFTYLCHLVQGRKDLFNPEQVVALFELVWHYCTMLLS